LKEYCEELCFLLGVRSWLMEGWDPLWWVFRDIGDKEKDVF
jgi:hypothetical protein